MAGSDRVLGALAALVGPCPVCHNGRLTATFDGVQTNLLCERCGACWRPDVDCVRRVDPAACPGCPLVDTCAEARRRWAEAQEDHPAP
jgi:hypothetical protein